MKFKSQIPVVVSNIQKMSQMSSNKSSSFYSEAYYEKARRESSSRKNLYRERNKQLYDQQHQLELQKIYINRTGTCELIKYYELFGDIFGDIKQKDVKGNEQYKEASDGVLAKMNEKIKFFHEFLMNQFYLTKQEFDKLKKEDIDPYQYKKEEGLQFKITVRGQNGMRLDCCNMCPIFIEQFQWNLARTQTLIMKQSSYWDKLNGNQKVSKFKRHIQQLLRILKYELENKCQYSAIAGKASKAKSTKLTIQSFKRNLPKVKKLGPKRTYRSKQRMNLSMNEQYFDIEDF